MKKKNNLTKKEIIRRFNRLIEEGRIFANEELSEIMEAYKVSKVGSFSKYNYTCCICHRKVSEDDFFVSCRMKGTSHMWKNTKPIHIECLSI